MRDLPPPRQRAPTCSSTRRSPPGRRSRSRHRRRIYVTRVARRKPGDALLLFNGRAGEWRAETAVLACWQAALGDWFLV